MIEFREVCKRFGKKDVLKGVDLVCQANQITVLIGPSGCGKSTTLRLILQLIKPDSGQILVNGEDISRFTKAALEDYRSQIGMAFQSSALFDSMRVWENVGFSLLEKKRMPRDEVRAIAEEKLQLVGLEDSADLFPVELSGGMQRRVGFARAIAQNPAIILYDEPTTGLDPITSTIIEDLIISLQEKTGATSIVVTHQLSTVFRTADTISMFNEGVILDTGTPSQMKNSKNKLVRNFLEGKVEDDSSI